MSPSPTSELLHILEPILNALAELDPAQRRTAADQAQLVRALGAAFPWSGSLLVDLGQRLRRGVGEGWLCDRGEPHARFCRLAKATPATRNFSVDLVALAGEGAPHTHPQGEITIAWALDPEGGPCAFDGHSPGEHDGWIFSPPGSSHTPTVVGATMLLLYFLPDGAVTWN